MSQQPCIYDVPMALDLDLSRTAGLEPLLAKARHRGLIYDLQSCTVGPMPIPSFLDVFLPQLSEDRSALLSFRNAFMSVPSRADSVAEIYKPLTSALNKRTKFKSRCPGFTFMRTFEHSIRPLRLGYAKPHICCVKAENSLHIQNAHPGSRIEFGYAELFIHIVADPTDDIFADPASETPEETLADHEFLRSLVGEDGEINRRNYRQVEGRYKTVTRAHGLHAAFAVETFARQQRLFLFTISLAGSMARFYRWDRSGCVVSRSFDIREHPETLVEFLWRFSNLTDAFRGHDLTVRMASAAEEALFKSVVWDYLALQLDGTGDNLEKALSAHYCPGRVTVASVSSQSSGTADETSYYIVSRPIVSPLSLDGRSTRGYWAVNASSGQIAFLKDTWRTPSQQEVEGEILLMLKKHGVRNIPVLAVHGDVRDRRWVSSDGGPGFQETMTDRFAKMPWASRMDGKAVIVHRRRHYRLVTHTVGQSMKTLRGTEELLHSTYDVFVAMRDAFAKNSRMHRDLSVGNIVLVKESDRTIRRGYLIDWDASDRVDELGESLQRGRAGTWAFLSIRMLERENQDAKHTFKDDMEALIYVVLYCALFYTPHNLDPVELTAFHQDFFQDRGVVHGVEYGGKGKAVNARRRLLTEEIQFSSPAFQEWLNTVLDYHTPSRELMAMGEMWQPEILDTYWSQFLQTRTLERDNRTVHQIIKRDRYDSDSPYSEPVPSPPPPSQHHIEDVPGRRHKRDREADEEAVVSSSRLRRVGEDLPLRPSGLPLRRSQRIREQRSRLQGVAAPAPSPQDSGSKSAAGGRARVPSTIRRRK